MLAQDYPALEYVVVDDGSTDDTVKRLGRLNSEIRVISQGNAGEQRAVNRGVRESRGELLAVVNADDPLLPGFLDLAIKYLSQYPNAAGVYPEWLKIDREGNVLEIVRPPQFDYARMLKRHLCDIGPGCLFRRRALGDEAPRDPRFRFSGDFQQWLRMGLHRSFVRIPQVLATWRFHETGTTQTSLGAALAAEKVAVVEDLFSRHDVPTDVRAMRDEAISSAHFTAAVLALQDPQIPARYHMWKSLRAKAIWGPLDTPECRRTWRLILFTLGLPLTLSLSSLYRRVNDLRPRRTNSAGPHYSVWSEIRRSDSVR